MENINNMEDNLGWKNQTKSENIMSISFTKYNVPVFSENTMKDFISYGADNLYPAYLIECLNRSATHNSIVEAKVKQIMGTGLAMIETEDKTQLALVNKFLKNSNRYESMNDLIRKIAFDFVVFGGYALNIIWSKDRSKIAEVHHVDFSTLRVCKPNDKSNEVEGYYFSENWAQYMKPKFKPRFIPKFNMGDRINPSQILYVKPYRPNTLFYPLPSYIGGLNYIELDYQLSNYQLNSLMNGLSPSIMINFNNGQPSQEEREEIYRSIRANFTGTDSAGKFLLFFNKSKETSAEVTPIQTNEIDKIYTVLNESVVQNIMTAHRVTSPALLGIPSPGQFGSSQELILASELFFNQVIAPDQQYIEETLNKILDINGFTLTVELNDLQPVSYQVSESVLLQICTIDEVRKKLGYQPLTTEQKVEIDNRNGTAMITTGNNVVKTNQTEQEPIVTNDVLRSLSGRQHQGLLRIIKQVANGKLSKEQATVLLTSGYGFTNDQINQFLSDQLEEDFATEYPEIHPNCRCKIVNGEYIAQADCCDTCANAEANYNSN